jgi:hypothetical protein
MAPSESFYQIRLFFEQVQLIWRLRILYRPEIIIGIRRRYVLYKESSLLQELADFADFYVSLHRYYISLRQIGDKLGETGVFCLMKCTKFPTFSFKKLYKSLHIPSF